MEWAEAAQILSAVVSHEMFMPSSMMKPADAERLTGFKVGGISPFGQKKAVPTAIDETTELYDEVLINGGQRGLLVGLKPTGAVQVVAMKVVDLLA